MTELYDLVLHAPRAVTLRGEAACTVAVRGRTIAAVTDFGTDLAADRVVRLAADEVLLPGLVDTHVHVNDPGRTEWEGFASATRAAAAGGVSTIVDMPLNSLPPTVEIAALEVKRKAAEENCFVDVGFWGGAIPGNVGDLRPLHDAGVFGFKCFLADSGVEEFPHLEPAEFVSVVRAVAEFDGLMIVHAEDGQALEHAPSGGPRVRRVPGLRATRCGKPGHRRSDRGGPVDRRPVAYPAPVVRGCTADDPLGAAGRAAADRRRSARTT